MLEPVGTSNSGSPCRLQRHGHNCSPTGNDHIKVAPSYKRTSISTRQDQPRQEIHVEPLKALTRKEAAKNKTRQSFYQDEITADIPDLKNNLMFTLTQAILALHRQRENETGTKRVTAAVNTDYLTSAP